MSKVSCLRKQHSVCKRPSSLFTNAAAGCHFSFSQPRDLPVESPTFLTNIPPSCAFTSGQKKHRLRVSLQTVVAGSSVKSLTRSDAVYSVADVLDCGTSISKYL